MYAIIPGLLYSLVFTLVVGGLNLAFRRKSYVATAVEAVVSLLLNWFFIWAILWWGLPSQTGFLWGYAWLLWPLLLTSLIFLVPDVVSYLSTDSYEPERTSVGLGGVLALIVVVVLTIGFLISNIQTRTQGDADYLASQIKVTVESPDAYPDTDTNHIVTVPEETALFKASQHMASASTKLNGTGSEINLATLYKLGTGQLQSVAQHLYWIFPLDFNSRRTWNQVGKVSPGYIVVDAENPDAATFDKLGYSLRYTPDAWYSNKLDRLLFTHGYANYVIDDLTLEVDDNWHPYFTAALDQRTLHNGGQIPVAMIIIDPGTGTITRHSLDDIPDWVDRIYSADTAERMLNWWGNYADKAHSPFRLVTGRSNAGRYHTVDSPVLVYTTDKHPAWQMTLTSFSKDTSIVYVALFDTRDNVVRLYDNIKGTATEDQVRDTFHKIQANVRGDYIPTHLAMHRIYGTPTWVANYITPSDNKNAQGAPIAGIGFVNANDLQVTSIAFGKTKAEALQNYRKILAQGTNNTAPGATALKAQTVKGTVDAVAQQIENGNTAYLVVLKEQPTRVYKAVVSADDETNLIELPFVKEGDKVVIVYTDVGQNPVDVQSFNDLSVPIVP